jgi:hypothetical protein
VVSRWLTNGRYYQLNLVSGDHKNPEYRIAEDLRIARFARGFHGGRDFGVPVGLDIHTYCRAGLPAFRLLLSAGCPDSEGRPYERGRTGARTAGRRRRIHHGRTAA